MSHLVASDLSKSFHKKGDRIEVLRDLSFEVAAGEFVSIVGASGCGKTTLLRLMNGLIAPSSGRVLLGGEPILRPGGDIGFVFQQDGLLPWRSVMQNAILGPELQKRPLAEARIRAAAFLKMVGLKGFDPFYPHELSGGMKQRANIVRALTVGADVLLMDEPFAALDAQTREIMQSELLRVWRQTGKTVLFVTHQIDEAVYLSDRILVLTVRPGRLKKEIRIDLPRPRELSIKRTAEFARYTDSIWNLIEEEVREGIKREAESYSSAHD